MAFDLGAIKKEKEASGKFLDVQQAVEDIINSAEYESKLQKLCEDAVKSGDDRAEVILSFIKENRGDITVELTSSNCMILHYELARGVNQDNIKNIGEGYWAIVKKMENLGLTGSRKPSPSMSKGGYEFDFDNTVEHQTYENKVIINLRDI